MKLRLNAFLTLGDNIHFHFSDVHRARLRGGQMFLEFFSRSTLPGNSGGGRQMGLLFLVLLGRAHLKCLHDIFITENESGEDVEGQDDAEGGEGVDAGRRPLVDHHQ